MEQNTANALDPRLRSAASFVRRGSVVADIGSDHGYLPIYLVGNGTCVRAIASDIRDGPVARARKNVIRSGMADRISVVKSDGLKEIRPEDNGVTDICICGMGGETISEIIEESAYTRKPGVRLILQAMTKVAELREYLISEGFSIIDEDLSESRGHIYTVMLAEHISETVPYSPVELLLGRRNIEKGGRLFGRFAGQHEARLRKQIRGMKKGGLDAGREEELLSEVEEILRPYRREK